MPASPKNYDYKSAAYALSEEQAWARETAEMNKGFLDVGKRIEETRGSLQRLTAQVKSADEIFTRTARRGEIFGVRALTEFAASHQKINELFSKSSISWTHGFEAVQSHAQGAAGSLIALTKSLLDFQGVGKGIATDYEKALRRQSELAAMIADAEKDGLTYVSQRLAKQKSEVDRAVVIAHWETKMVELRKASIPLMITFGATVGRVLAQSFELQRNFRDVSLDFSKSVDFSHTLLTAIGSSGGLVTLKEAAEAARALRSYSLDFLKPQIIENVSLMR